MRAPKRSMVHLLTLSVLVVSMPVTFAAVISIDPRGTYLRTQDDFALSPVILNLASNGIYAGDLIRIDRLGFYSAASFIPDTGSSLIAVFSGSATLLSGTNLNRVQDAIDAGTDFFTSNTLNNNLTTDIGQDFAIDDGSTFSFVELYVPAGAQYLFFTVNDSYFTDNTDPNGDFQASLVVVPEPSTSTLVFAGLLAGIWRRYHTKA